MKYVSDISKTDLSLNIPSNNDLEFEFVFVQHTQAEHVKIVGLDAVIHIIECNERIPPVKVFMSLPINKVESNKKDNKNKCDSNKDKNTISCYMYPYYNKCIYAYQYLDTDD